ncbi:MAG: hypothetical protein ACNA8W_09465, partial [Bradymonadaceae bacterium]
MSGALKVIEQHPFVENFLAQVHLALGAKNFPESALWLAKAKKVATERLQTLDLPGPKHEEWRFTRLKGLAAHRFAAAGKDVAVATALVEDLWLTEAKTARVVFINGRFSPVFSHVSGLPEGARVTTWRELIAGGESAVLRDRLGANPWFEDDLFYTLNSALFEDGVVILVPRNTKVVDPIQVVYIGAGGEEPFATHPRNMIVAGEG